MSIRNLSALCCWSRRLPPARSSRPGARKSTLPGGHPPDEPRYFGWVDDPAAVRECLAESGLPARFRETPAFAAGGTGPRMCSCGSLPRRSPATCSRRATRSRSAAASGSRPPRPSSTCSACRSQTAKREYRDLAPGGDLRRVARRDRRRAGPRGRLHRGVGGEVGPTDYGVVPRGIHGKHDLRALRRSAGAATTAAAACPTTSNRWRRNTRSRSVANVRTWEECRAAIRNGYPVLVCSSQGFAMKRDADGFCNAARDVVSRDGRGRRSRRRAAGRVPAELVGTERPHAARGVRPMRRRAGFWADAACSTGMLRQGDSWAFSRVVGFPPRQ